MRTEWDPKRAISNRAKHGVSFEEAATIHGRPVLEMFDDTHSNDREDRFIAIGISTLPRFLTVVYTEDSTVRRLISARRSTKAEVQGYKAQGSL